MGTHLSSDQFKTQAMNETGLTDFGGNTYEAGLEAFLESLNTEIPKDRDTGYFQQIILHLLKNRLEVTRFIGAHPEILEEKIQAPVFIVGLPRSGTTILHTLLSLDPMARYLRNFETTGPVCPPPELMPKVPDPRIQPTHDALEGLFAMAPELRGINGINFMAQGTAECQNLMAHEFVHMGWSAGSSLFSHGNWVGDCNMTAAYEWHKRILQMLQWKHPNQHWVLKAPIHLFGLGQLLETYPDARLIFTHRNPVDAMVSGVSMVARWSRFTTGRADIPAIADWYPALWAKGLERTLKIKSSLPENSYTEIHHGDLSRAPIDTVAGACDRLRLSLSPAAERRMEVWLRDNPRTGFGTHNCSAEDFGLDPGRIKKTFSFYREAI
ncbi:MAG: sulfotransferase [Desulfobacterales bacterium]|nr:sulfotransferase [Desulfobacterales bacterium]